MDSKQEAGRRKVEGGKEEKAKPSAFDPRASSLFVFLEMIKFEHSIFALPFAYLGLILAERGWPRTSLLILITIAMVSFRTMAMGLNRLIDAAIDSRNPRTKNRAIPAGKLKSPFVWGITLISALIFEAAVYRLGGYCWTLSPVCIFLAWLYPFTKRFTWLSHTVLGIILGIAPYGAWLASRQEFSWIPGFLMIGIASWVAGFDIIYALQDLDFDKSAGLYSIPSRFGRDFSLRLTRVLHLVTLISWVLVGVAASLGPIYFAGMVLAAAFLVREHWLISSFGLEKLNEAFFTMNAIVSIAVLAAVIADFSLGSYLR